jgi:hypothetical protein
VSDAGASLDTSADWLIGSWQLLRCDAPLEILPGTRMHFATDKQLEYAIPAEGRLMRVTLRWRVDGAVLHTEHFDGSNPVDVGIARGEADVLTFDFGGPRAWFVRAR